MRALSEIRADINRIDAALKTLLKERMDCAGEVAAAKQHTALQNHETPVIFVGPREEEILAAVDAGVHTDTLRKLMKEIMGVSRRHQYHLLQQSAALADRLGAYIPGSVCRLNLKEGTLTEALRIVLRYDVKVLQADSDTLTVTADDAGELQARCIQLFSENYMK